MDATAPEDRDLISRWAARQDGLVLDVGCGPGHWAVWIASRGVRIRGLDPVPEFVDITCRAHPDLGVTVGGFEDLAPVSSTGNLAWYSLIHTPPVHVPRHLGAAFTALQPGGSLLLGFFGARHADAPTPLAHAVAPAWIWPASRTVRLLEETGFVVLHQEHRTDAGARPHLVLEARRS